MAFDMGRMTTDTGDASARPATSDADPDVKPSTPPPAASIGARLQSAREAHGLTLEDLAGITKVSRYYLAAIEDMRLDALPSRPFAIGYVRAYAEAVGLDPDVFVARFRQDAPEPEAAFRAPVGVAFESSRRAPVLIGAAVAVLAAFVMWNVAQRAMTPDDPTPAPVAQAAAGWAEAPPPAGPFEIGAATPPPADQTIPAPYITPGLEEAYAAVNGLPSPAAEAAMDAATPMAPVRAAFNPRGAVYGAQPERATVILQATKSATIIVRGRGGEVHFARQLAEGESYRAPSAAGLVAELSDPAAFDLYRDGELQGPLAEPQVSLDKLARATPSR